jgi:hypothetical protein
MPLRKKRTPGPGDRGGFRLNILVRVPAKGKPRCFSRIPASGRASAVRRNKAQRARRSDYVQLFGRHGPGHIRAGGNLAPHNVNVTAQII